MTANHAALLRRVAAEANDRDLLSRFVAARDGDAFAELVRRYGPAVFGVCLRVTRQRQDAEDAFQAVFVILARRADTLQKPELLGNWLYGVAVRVARKARRTAGRRRVRETTVTVMPEPAVDPLPPTDHGSVIDEELAALPEWYRDAVLLCDLYGHSRTEAATRLGIPEGTLSSRLAAGRKKLAERLARRGVTLAALVAVAVPAELANAAVASALLTVAGIPIEAGIESLTHEGGRAMTKLFGWCMVAVATIGVGVGAVMALPEQKAADPVKADATPQDKPAAKEAPAKPAVKPKLIQTIDIRGTINSEPMWSPDGRAVGFRSSQSVRLWNSRDGTLYERSDYPNRFLGFGTGKTELLWHHTRGGAINGSAHLIGTTYSGEKYPAVDLKQWGEEVTLVTELDRDDGTPSSVILQGKAVLAYRIDLVSNPKFGQVRTFGGSNPFVKGETGSGPGTVRSQPEPREIPGAIRFRVIDTATGEAGPDIIKAPIGPVGGSPWIVTPQGDRLVVAYQVEKSMAVECYTLPDGKKLWTQTIATKGATASFGLPPFDASGGGSMVAFKNYLIPDPPEPPQPPQFGGTPGGGGRSSFAQRDYGIHLFNLATGEPGPKLPETAPKFVQDMSLSHDGRYLALTTGDRSDTATVQVWDLRAGKLLKSWNGSARVAFAPDRLVLAIAESSGNSGILGLWDLSPLVR